MEHRPPCETDKEERITETKEKLISDEEENEDEDFYDNWEDYFLDSCRYKLAN